MNGDKLSVMVGDRGHRQDAGDVRKMCPKSSQLRLSSDTPRRVADGAAKPHNKDHRTH